MFVVLMHSLHLTTDLTLYLMLPFYVIIYAL